MTITRQLIVLALIATTQQHDTHSLPITSKPLASNPDHLPYDTQFAIKSFPMEDVRPKIAKSIFIAPSFSMSSPPTCQPGYTLKHEKCHRDNIQVDAQAMLLQQALGAFESFPHDDGDNGPTEYDYVDDSSSSDTGPYHVPLTLSFGSDSTSNSPSLADALQGSPFRQPSIDQTNFHSRRTTDNLPTPEPDVQPTPAAIAPHTDTDVDSNAHMVAPIGFQSLVNNPAPETATRPMDFTAEATEATTTTTTTEMSMPSIATTTEDIQFNTIPTTTNDEQERGDNETIEKQNRLALAQFEEQQTKRELVPSAGSAAAITDADELNKELKEESLIRDETTLETTTQTEDMITSTTISPDADDGITTSTTDVPTTLADHSKTTPEGSTPPTTSTESRVHIVTPETSTAALDLIAATELLNKETGIESEVTKRQRETVLKHERNEDAREHDDQGNRFVYTHLGTTPTMPSTASSASTSRATHSALSLRERLNLFHRHTEENRKRVKFPDSNNPQSEPFAPKRTSGGSSIKFPSSSKSSQRAAPRTRPLFAWLPPDWKFEQTAGGRPNIKARPAQNFWNGMPLIRDPALAGGAESTDRAARANSRSPTEQLFRQEEAGREQVEEEEDDVAGAPPTDDVYKVVVPAKNFRYHNR